MELTVEQKAEIFDWFCVRCECAPLDARPFGDDYGNRLSVNLYEEGNNRAFSSGADGAEALYNAYLKDKENDQ